MNFEQSFAKGGKGESSAEAPDNQPYRREDLLDLLAERQRYVADALVSAEEVAIPEAENERAAALGAKSARVRQLSEWSDALSSAIKKFAKPSKAELRDPASAGQVWISRDFQKRLDRIGKEQEEGTLAVENLYLKQREDERSELERDTEARVLRGEKTREIIGDKDVEMELEDQDIQPIEAKAEKVIGDEDVELELEAHDIEPIDLEKRKTKKRSRAENEAYVAKVGEKLAAEEDTQVDYVDPFAPFLEERTRERAKASPEDRERLVQAQMLEAMEELEQLSVEALSRVSKLWSEMKGLKKRLSELRTQLAGGSGMEIAVIATVEAAAQQMKEDGDAAMKDVLMIEKQIAHLRSEMVPQQAAAEEQEISLPPIKIPRSRPGLKKSA